MISFLRRPVFVLVLFSSCIFACQSGQAPQATDAGSRTKEKTMQREITIWLGEHGDDLFKRYPKWTSIDGQPAGLDFYEINLDQRPNGIVTFKHGNHSFVVPHALDVSTFESRTELKDEGFTSYSIGAGITEPELISHDEARIKMYALLKDLMDKGWQRYIDASEPRLKGKASFYYTLNVTDLYGLDPTYVPSLEEWMAIESRTPWDFYADGVYLKVTFTRERTLTDPDKPGAYLITYNLITATEKAKSYVAPIDRPRYKELGPVEFAKYPAYRQQAEAALRAKGVEIYEDYNDPPPPSFR